MQFLKLNKWINLFTETEQMKTTERKLISKTLIKFHAIVVYASQTFLYIFVSDKISGNEVHLIFKISFMSA